MRWFMLLAVTTLLAFTALCAACAAGPNRPLRTEAGGISKSTRIAGASGPSRGSSQPVNFVFILVDDLGWSDVSYHGSPFYQTPHIDQLASQGMVFTSGYAPGPLCSASRASILSGQYPARIHLTSALVHFPDGRFYVDPVYPWQAWIAGEEVECLPLETETLAERLSAAGYTTAHIGKWHLGQPPYRPEKQGFDLNVGGSFYPAPRSYFSPYRMEDVIQDGPEGEYLTDRLTDEAIRFLRDQKENRQGQPFYLQLWHYAVHTPIQAKQELEEKYQSNVNPDAPHRNPAYAAMIESTDLGIGRVLRTLEELELDESTMVILTSDNGGLLSLPNTRVHVTSNTPLRGGKAMLWEGGIRVPMIVRWPGVVQPGSKCDTPVSGMDLYPTLMEIGGVSEIGGVAEIGGVEAPPEGPIDGESLLPLLKQEGELNRQALFWHFPRYIPVFHGYDVTPASAVRMGDYKLIKSFDTGLELYDLKNDIGETHNLATTMPDRAAQMETILEEWYRGVDANLPTPNPGYDPDARPTGEIFDFDPADATLVNQWTFDDGDTANADSAGGDGPAPWQAAHDCQIATEAGRLVVTCTDNDPFLVVPTSIEAGSTTVTLRFRAETTGFGQLFWITPSQPHHHHTRSHRFHITHGDGQWHEVAIHLQSREAITGLRLDTAGGKGTVEIDWFRVYR